MDQTGFVAIALAGLWIAYLVPQRLRYRQQLLDSCVEDRFSGELRVLRVAGAWSAAHDGRDDATGHDAIRSTGRIHPVRALPGPETTTQGPTAGPERGGRTMDRPHAGRDRTVADAARHTAAEHAARAAYLARRAAAARRRAALTGVLLLAVLAGWGSVAVGALGLAAGVVPSALLVGVLALGRRAVLAGARADARWAAGEGARPPVADAVRAARSASAAPRVVGRAVHPSEATTEVMARLGERRDATGTSSSSAAPARAERGPADTAPVAAGPDAGRATPAERAGAADVGGGASTGPVAEEPESTWVPVPVPRPAYTLKPMARRPEPAPLVLDEEPADRIGTAATDVGAKASGANASGAADDATTVPPSGAGPDDATPTTGGLSLDAILARRRAAGE